MKKRIDVIICDICKRLTVTKEMITKYNLGISVPRLHHKCPECGREVCDNCIIIKEMIEEVLRIKIKKGHYIICKECYNKKLERLFK